MSNKFPERLRKLRKKRGLTIKDFSKEINVAASTVSMYESGHREPNIDMILMLCKELDTTSDYLLGLSEVNNKSTTDNSKLIYSLNEELGIYKDKINLISEIASR